MGDSFIIDFEPIGRRGKALPGQTLLDVARTAGVGLASVCGGVGTCEECRVRLSSGSLSKPTLIEEAVLSRQDLDRGIRLACQAEPLSNVKLDIPPESLTASQRLQLDGMDNQELELNPVPHAPGALGFAMDIGTTKLAAYLVALDTGETIARAGAMNPQIAYGEDVISRIAFAGRNSSGARELQSVLIDRINELVAGMCTESSTTPDMIVDSVFVGNTIMHHLFSGLPVEQLGRAPFTPSTTSSLSIPAASLGLCFSRDASAYLPPVIAGYVGADHLAMLLATGMSKYPSGNILALDIGTNTEIALLSKGRLTCCSCASGPAFEGAHIHEGMRAAPGAIERARWSEGRIIWQTIDAQPPVGICGSGILDVVAALQDGGLVKPTGMLRDGLAKNRSKGFVLVPANETGFGRDLLVTRKDINEIQLAKSAIRSGLEILLRGAGIKAIDLEEFIVAGAFGTFLDIRSAVRTGMFPDLSMEKFRQVGNAAGTGARQMLLSVNKRKEVEGLAREITYVELTTEPLFTPLFMDYLKL